MTRDELEERLPEHPGVIEIWGVTLDLALQADASLAAQWLDWQLAETLRMLPRRDPTPETHMDPEVNWVSDPAYDKAFDDQVKGPHMDSKTCSDFVQRIETIRERARKDEDAVIAEMQARDDYRGETLLVLDVVDNREQIKMLQKEEAAALAALDKPSVEEIFARHYDELRKQAPPASGDVEGDGVDDGTST